MKLKELYEGVNCYSPWKCGVGSMAKCCAEISTQRNTVR